MAEQIHWKAYTNPDYLGSYSFSPNEEKVLTIKDVVRREVKNESNKADTCTVLLFKENVKPMILNATNAKVISAVHKSAFVSDWVGKKIQVYVLYNQKVFGEIRDVLRIRPKSPDKPFLTPESPRWAAAVDKLRGGSTSLEAIKNSFQLSKEHEQILLKCQK